MCRRALSSMLSFPFPLLLVTSILVRGSARLMTIGHPNVVEFPLCLFDKVESQSLSRFVAAFQPRKKNHLSASSSSLLYFFMLMNLIKLAEKGSTALWGRPRRHTPLGGGRLQCNDWTPFGWWGFLSSRWDRWFGFILYCFTFFPHDVACRFKYIVEKKNEQLKRFYIYWYYISKFEEFLKEIYKISWF